MDDRHTVLVDDAHLHWHTGRGRPEEHRHVGIVGLERSPGCLNACLMSSFEDTVLPSVPIDVHAITVGLVDTNVNIC